QWNSKRLQTRGGTCEPNQPIPGDVWRIGTPVASARNYPTLAARLQGLVPASASQGKSLEKPASYRYAVSVLGAGPIRWNCFGEPHDARFQWKGQGFMIDRHSSTDNDQAGEAAPGEQQQDAAPSTGGCKGTNSPMIVLWILIAICVGAIVFGIY